MESGNTTHMIGAAPSAGLPAGVGVVSSGATFAALALMKRDDDELLNGAAGCRSIALRLAPPPPPLLPTNTTAEGRSHCVVLVVWLT